MFRLPKLLINDNRTQVVEAARSWVGTPYHHAADVKGAGVDCAMILVRVFVDLGVVAPFDPRPYTSDWYLHRSEERYLNYVLQYTQEVFTPNIGDIMVFKIGRCYAHGGIISNIDPLTIIHAFAPARCVLEDEIHRHGDLADKAKTARFFSYWH